jgi:two-component sensor histidine kinase
MQSAKAARDFTAATLRGWQLDALADDAVIIASELVTNAIRHGTCVPAGEAGHPPVMLAWQQHAGRLTCMVMDENAGPSVLTSAGPDSECGRGLQVVQALAAEWGWMMLDGHEKAVWAALCLPDAM